MATTQHQRTQQAPRRSATGPRPEATMPPRRRRTLRPTPRPATDQPHNRTWKPVRPTAQRIHEAALLAEFE
ncbi:hypothetical protein [Streptomyces clavuligerus]|uniref:hypothetical protein n=1 Tax=Streptomyces clavuligerus TaxID=1901 RepID=UPI0001851F5B|nr:hypothetical protein [Streptomyces clavuligerus]ANW16934.1 hypothetical protein BB341_01165 [Streptomyces clavuligerus]AXU11462.1 hypothetical protein D1794_01235 [Streptomyces clavuligerus]MBY6301281.1 hypothetical protein [Streptomyces clavuligerus]QCS04334.1 hypothetical protein CRV15_01235 [Streptomyces clavuligerus]QPJ96279.1 hypothetical protein GE265_26635 [Streptomyces clavuligerus]